MRHGRWRTRTPLSERWDRRIDDARVEAGRERTRATVASITARVRAETAIELPCSVEGAWVLLFETGDRSPLRDPDKRMVSLPGPGAREVGHRATYLKDWSSAGLVWQVVESERGVVRRSECESTPGVWVAYRFEALGTDRCRLTLAEEFGAPEGTRDAWQQALEEAHHVRLGKVFSALTGAAPPAPFGAALAFAEAFPASLTARPAVGDELLVKVRLSESVDVRATASQVWQLVRDLTRVGLPDVHDDGHYVPTDPGEQQDETWVGLRSSALGTPVAIAVSVADEVPGRRFVARAIGGRAATTVEVVPTAEGCAVTVEREAAFREDDLVIRGRWQRALARYARQVARAAAQLG